MGIYSSSLFLDRPDETLSSTILPGFAHMAHRDLDMNVLEALGVGRSRALDVLARA